MVCLGHLRAAQLLRLDQAVEEMRRTLRDIEDVRKPQAN
jgi:hypothetical protein